ncbi:AEC family transporter [Chloroflexota bacterium]
MFNVLNSILPTFIIILVGYIFGKLNKINFSSVVDLAFYAGTPSLIFVSLIHKKIVLLDAFKVWGASIIIILGCGAVAWIVFTILRQKHSGLYLPIMQMNAVNLAFPVIYFTYGSEGLIAATLFAIPTSLFLYTLGIYIVAGKNWKKNIKELFKIPMIYALILGLLFNLSDLEMPLLLTNSIEVLAMMGIPLVLLSLGYNLSRAEMTSLPTTLLASFLRVGVGFLFGLLAVEALNITGIFRSVVILESVMPSAVLASLITAKYNREADLVASVIFVTTIVALLTVPFILNILA